MLSSHATIRSIVLSVSAIVACANEWPPGQEAARQHFRSHRPELETLVRHLRLDGFDHVTLTDVTPPVMIDPSTPEIDPERSQEWAALLHSAEVDDVRRDGADYFLRSHDPLGHSDGVGWEQVLVLRSEQIEPDRLCGRADRSQECGNCHVYLADHWYLHYIWFPKDDWQRCLKHESSDSARS